MLDHFTSWLGSRKERLTDRETDRSVTVAWCAMYLVMEAPWIVWVDV